MSLCYECLECPIETLRDSITQNVHDDVCEAYAFYDAGGVLNCLYFIVPC